MSRPVRTLSFRLVVLTGALLGLVVSAVWWLRLSNRTCLGGPCEGTPPGDITLILGASIGTALGLSVALILARFRSR